MKAHPLPKLQEWDQFELFAVSLQQLGWNPKQKADGPDARSWGFSREAESIWLVFDDVLGGSLKSESEAINLGALAAQLEANL